MLKAQVVQAIIITGHRLTNHPMLVDPACTSTKANALGRVVNLHIPAQNAEAPATEVLNVQRMVG